MTKQKSQAATSVESMKQQTGLTLSYSQQAAEAMFSSADVAKVYGKPIKHEGTIIIPAAEVLWVGGFGAGAGMGESPLDEQNANVGTGEGSGGGGRTFARPVAVIIASEQGVRIEPVIDPTKILLAALTAGGFMAAMALRMLSPRKAMRKIRMDKS